MTADGGRAGALIDTAPQPEFAVVGDSGTFEVWARRFDGTARLYQSYPQQEIAESVAAALRRVGLPCEVRCAGARAR